MLLSNLLELVRNQRHHAAGIVAITVKTANNPPIEILHLKFVIPLLLLEN
jgi:hypothetical protein